MKRLIDRRFLQQLMKLLQVALLNSSRKVKTKDLKELFYVLIQYSFHVVVKIGR